MDPDFLEVDRRVLPIAGKFVRIGVHPLHDFEGGVGHVLMDSLLVSVGRRDVGQRDTRHGQPHRRSLSRPVKPGHQWTPFRADDGESAVDRDSPVWRHSEWNPNKVLCGGGWSRVQSSHKILAFRLVPSKFVDIMVVPQRKTSSFPAFDGSKSRRRPAAGFCIGCGPDPGQSGSLALRCSFDA